MAITLVQSNSAFSGFGSTPNVLFSSSLTVGNLVVVVVYSPSQNVSSVTDSKGNTYTLQKGSGGVGIWTAPITTGGSSASVTATLAGSGSCAIIIAEFHGGATLAVDTSAGYFTTNPNQTTTPYTLSGASPFGSGATTECLLIAAAFDTGTPTHATDAYTAITQTMASLAYVLSGTSGTSGTSWSISFAGTLHSSSLGIALYESGGGGPPNPPTRQPDQRHDLLPDLTAPVYQQRRLWPVPLTFTPVQDKPTPHQGSQLIIRLPDLHQEWAVYAVRTLTTSYKPDLPPSKPPSQQLSYMLPDFNYVAYEQWRRRPIAIGATSVTSKQQGQYGIYNTVSFDKSGQFRIANNIAGYNLYVGLGAIPDLTAGPTAFSLTLPFSYTLPLPGAGTRVYYLLVRAQNQYGLESQNQYYTTITLDSSGNQVFPAATPPANLTLYAVVGGIRVLASYPGYFTDSSRATTWRVWISSSPINPANPATASVDVLSANLGVDLSSYASGTWYVGVALFRNTDSTQSALLTGTIFLPATPGTPKPVAGGYQQ